MTIEQTVEIIRGLFNEQGIDALTKEELSALTLAIRSLKAWQKVREELKEEMTGLDMFIEKEHTIRWCLHVIDNALREVGEQNGNRL